MNEWVLAWMVGLMEGWMMDAWIDVDVWIKVLSTYCVLLVEGMQGES